MPSTDETYYNLRRLHVVFAISSLALLAVTVWMLAADHQRPWKQYQRTFRDRIDPWVTEAAIDRQRTGEFLAREKELAVGWDEARRAVPKKSLIWKFRGEVEDDAARRKADPADFAKLHKAYDRLAAAPSETARDALLEGLEKFIAGVTLRLQNAERKLRSRRAEFDETRSDYEAAVGEGLPQKKLDRGQQRVDHLTVDVKRLTAELQDVSAHRETLGQILAEITHQEDAARKALDEHRAVLDRLDRTLTRQRPSLAKRLLRLPLIDALGRPLSVDQIWLPDLTIDYNFRQVARFDRCVTCHQAIDKTQPGEPSEPAYGGEETLTVELATPDQAPVSEGSEEGKQTPPTLRTVYGLVLAERGILDANAATVARVLPKTLAAEARLLAGDVIVKINGHRGVDQPAVRKRLLKDIEWGQPLTLQIRRGLPLPYGSHPRGDLFVGSLSPHPMAEFGCTICHDGQGSATAFEWASHTPNDPGERTRWRKQYGWFSNRHWDFPMLAKRFAQSRCLKCHHDVTDLEPSRQFPDPPAAKLLAGYHLIRQNGCFGCHEINGYDDLGRSIGPDMRLEPSDPQIANGSIPGTMRKVGPSLREVAGKLDAKFLADWLRDPTRFLADARMPQFFGIHEHLDGRSLSDARRFEAVEIRAIGAYLNAVSRPVEAAAAPADVTEPPSAKRGKRLFQISGCLACHKHREFPRGKATEGRELTDVGAKFAGESPGRWLVSWMRDPFRHGPRTLMPNPLLEPIPLPSESESDAAAEPPKLTDPVADIAAFLLASTGDYHPADVPPVVQTDVDELALLHLQKMFSGNQAATYLREGIPEPLADQVADDAAELLGKISLEKTLRYVGRRTIRKRGCYGCHDIPGFEDAQPIGPALSDWGRKPPSQLAFGQIHQFLRKKFPEEAAGTDHDFFEEALLAHRREGFIWQKLRGPRSFDYKTTQNKAYNKQLTMGRFHFTDQQREAVITFVLGLLAEPPAESYVYDPDTRRKAIVGGRKVLDRYACATCHTLELERWTFEFNPEEFEPPPAAEDYDFLKPQLSPEQIAASLQTDNRGLGRGEVVGMPRVDADGQLMVADDDIDEDDNEIFMYGFTLFEPAAINGEVCSVGGADVLLWDHQITHKRPPRGGAFARLLYPVVLAEAQAAGSSAAGAEAWGWVPPPLVHEGAKVRPGWLHDYLLAPAPIRPAAVLRMPQYNMSPAEAGKLVDYFAAVSGAEFPYHSDPGNNPPQLADNGRWPDRIENAMKMLLDTQTYCSKCHLIGDFSPGGEIQTTLAPNLDRVGRRLRAEHIRRWLANPKSVLPYTGMPVNFPPTGDSVDPERFPGKSHDQLDAVMDLLLHYESYMKNRTSIRQWGH